MTVEADKPLWVTLLEGLGNLGNNMWDEIGKAFGFVKESPPKLPPSKPKNYLLQNRTNFQQYPVYNRQLVPDQNISWLDLPIHPSSDKTWREILGGIGKDVVIGGGITAIIMGIVSLASRKHNLYPKYILQIGRLSNNQMHILRNMRLSEQHINQLFRIVISKNLKQDALNELNQNIRRNLEHARLTLANHADYEMCFVAQNFNGHFIHKDNFHIDPINICVISQDHHVHNVIPNYLNYNHKRLGESIPRNSILLLDANILIDYEHRFDSEVLTLEAQNIEAIFDNATRNNNHIWITDRMADEVLPN